MSALGPGVLGPHKGSVACSEQELCIHESTEQGIARSAIESPQPLRLCRRQAKSGHLDVFALHTLKHVKRLLLCHFRFPRLVVSGSRPVAIEQRTCHDRIAPLNSCRSSETLAKRQPGEP
jgi:hypothetical protein